MSAVLPVLAIFATNVMAGDAIAPPHPHSPRVSRVAHPEDLSFEGTTDADPGQTTALPTEAPQGEECDETDTDPSDSSDECESVRSADAGCFPSFLALSRRSAGAPRPLESIAPLNDDPPPDDSSVS